MSIGREFIDKIMYLVILNIAICFKDITSNLMIFSLFSHFRCFNFSCVAFGAKTGIYKCEIGYIHASTP